MGMVIVACSSRWCPGSEVEWIDGFIFVGQGSVRSELYLDRE
jgi:hypothetical protein